VKLTLKIWRQEGPAVRGRLETYELDGVSTHMSFLEMLDVLNGKLELEGVEPVAFDHDCREGICGMCSLMINGHAHGPEEGTTVCQLHMRHFKDGDVIVVEPWRAKAFPIMRDLIVDRSAFDRIIEAGGFISVNSGSAQDANSLPVSKDNADAAMDAAACIGCGACVASCKNASAMLFVSAKVSHLAHLPQGQAERDRRALSMVATMDRLGFGNCTNTYDCEAACPKEIKISNIALLNRDFIKASLVGRKGV
jgi:succinate dehydrogenase / fumarate reductase iron-sulfur subunit